jgi:hypothetical protein
MAEHRPLAASEHRGHALAVKGKVKMANRIHPAVNAMQSRGRRCAAHSSRRIAQGARQLRNRDDAMLSFRQISQRTMWSSFAPHTV